MPQITIDFVGKTGTFETDVKRAARTLKQETSTIAADAAKFGKAFGAAIAAGVAGLVTLTKQSINTADQLTKMSAGLGVSVEQLSTLAYAADRSGVQLEQLRQGLTLLAKNASDMAAGTGEARVAFEALGISVKDSEGRLKPTEALLMEVADEFSGLEDSAQKTALAVKLFGESGTRLIPFLNQGSEGLADLQQAARDLGLEIDTTTGKLAEEFNDRLGDLGSLAKGLGNDIARELLPSLTQLATEAVESGKQMRTAGGFAEGFAQSLKVLLAAAFATKEAISVLTAGIAATVDVATTSIGILNSLNNLRLGRATADDILRLSTATEDLENVARNAADAFRGQFDESVRSFSETLTALFDPLKNTAEGANELGDSATKRAAPGLKNMAEEAKKAAEELKRLKKAQDDAVAGTMRLADEVDGWQRQTDDLLDSLDLEIRLLGMTNEQQEEYIALSRLGANATAEEVAELKEKLATFREMQELDAIARDLSAAFGEFAVEAITNFDDLGETIDDFFDSLGDMAKRAVAQMIAEFARLEIINPILNRAFGGNLATGGSQLGGLFGGGSGGFMDTAIGSSGATLGTLLGGAGLGFAVGGNWQGGALGAAGSFLGSAFGPIGSAIGSFIGGLIGGLFGDDPKPRIRINSSGAGIGNIGTRGSTSLGTLAFNADDLEDTRGTERQLLEAIQALDDGFVQLVNTFGLGEEQMAALRDAAAGWSVDLRNSAITAENVLGSRFSALLETFDADVQAFVSGAGDLEAQFAALSEALFIRAAAEAGQVGDTFDQVRDVLERFRIEGEALDQTYARVVASTMLLEEALEYAGVSLDIGRDAFITLANEIVEAAGGLQQAQSLWASFFETFYSEQERAAIQLEQAAAAAAAELGDIGLSLDEFTGSEGLARFRALFESVLPDLTADQVVAWLEAARALGILTDATAQYAQYIVDVGNALRDATKPDFSGGGAIFDPGAEIVPGGGVQAPPPPSWERPPLPDEWMDWNLPGAGGGGLTDAIDRTVDALNRWIDTLDQLQRDLLTDETLSVLTPAERLAEVERQYQDAFTGALAGDQASRDLFDQIARQFAEVGRDFFGSSDGYTDIFTRILADIGLLRSTAGAPATSSPALDNLVGGTSGGGSTVTSSAVVERLDAIIARQEQLETRVASIQNASVRTAAATEQTALNTEMQQERTYG